MQGLFEVELVMIGSRMVMGRRRKDEEEEEEAEEGKSQGCGRRTHWRRKTRCPIGSEEELKWKNEGGGKDEDERDGRDGREGERKKEGTVRSDRYRGKELISDGD